MLTTIKSKILIGLSQKHIAILEKCPRQFQDIYLEQLSLISTPEQQEKQAWGKNFHLLMQQRELGLDLDNFLSNNQEFSHFFQCLLANEPDLFISKPNQFREAEHCRSLSIEGYLFTVIYDLLIMREEQAQIIDWKTYLQPPNKSKLAKDWQTRLYLYVLAATSDYKPEQISFSYWFVKLPNKPQSFTFKYDSKQHEKTHQDLIRLVTRLDNYLDEYLISGTNFNHPTSNKKCKYCQGLG